MLRSRSVKRITPLLLFIVICAAVPLASFLMHRTALPAHAASSLPYHEFADGPYKVSGNQIIGADNKQYIFHGVGRDGLEFECTGDPTLDSAHLAFIGPGTSGPNGTYWWGNTVRLPLSEGFWLKGDAQAQCTNTQYQALVKSVVDNLTALKLNVVIDLMWTDAGGQVSGSGAGFMMPDADSVTFWKQVAPIYKSYSNVLFELYNEPHPNSWNCWSSACQISDNTTLSGKTYNYTSVGLQALANAVRGAGAANVIIASGLNWGFDLSQSQQSGIRLTDSGNNLAYDTHPYNYGGKQASNWDAAFGFLTATAPVMSLESGDYNCTTTYMAPLLAYFDAHQMSWVGWAWFSTGSACGYPQIITDWQGTPAASMGTLEYNQMLSYANQTPPSPTPNPSPTSTPPPNLNGPVSSTWYFAEGRVGGHFSEWLTLENPDNNACAVTINYLAQPDRGSAYTRQVSVNVPPASRVTEWVDGDLGTSPTGYGISDAAMLTVNSSVTPNCKGIVAERPMYYNALGANSGSDVLGLTHLGTTYYFGDVAEGAQPGGGSYSSFITILNPTGSQTATVTAKYYAGGNFITQQTATVPAGTRGTIVPSGFTGRVTAVVTSTQPVAVERPTYFNNINGGNAGIVSGGADVVGVQNLSNDWLFAEGYTGGQFQENFVIANVDPATKPASVNINLEFPDGSTKAYSVTVAPNAQAVWNVNSVAPSNSVSAEITSTGANILVEREMFFKYNHVGNGRSLQSIGGTDVLGMTGPVSASNYGFAEGYVNFGFDEWLTIQNPTNSPETVNIFLVNNAHGYYSTSVTVVAHSRYTVDITGMVIRSLYHSGEGFSGYEVSMVVQSSGLFVAERPMYWNGAGTQGGDDVIGYTGG